MIDTAAALIVPKLAGLGHDDESLALCRRQAAQKSAETFLARAVGWRGIEDTNANRHGLLQQRRSVGFARRLGFADAPLPAKRDKAQAKLDLLAAGAHRQDSCHVFSCHVFG